MPFSRSTRCTFSICVVSLLAGCGGSPLPIGAPGSIYTMASEAAATKLLYVSDLGTNLVNVYPYPKGKLIGKLSGFGAVAGLCSSKAGDVFVVDEAGGVQMFAHGGTSPIRKLKVSEAPYGCAVDPITRNLAVTNLSSYLAGALWVFRKAHGTAKVYKNSTINSTYFCAYDKAGNLWADGNDRDGKFIIVELPRNGSSLRVVHPKLPTTIVSPGGVQWDGQYIAVGDKGTGAIYRTKNGAVIQTVKLTGGTNVFQFWIQGRTLVGPSFQTGGNVSLWKYPSGGSPTTTVSPFVEPLGTTVSQ
jgi:hypothetical protein